MNRTRTLLLLLVLAAPLPAAAHSDEYLDTLSAPHGGQLRMAREYHYELVVDSGRITVYVTDHGERKFETAGASGRAIVLSGGKKTYVALSPAGDNLMAGSGEFAQAPDMKVVVSIALPGSPELSARFTPLAPRAGNPEQHAGHDHAGHGDTAHVHELAADPAHAGHQHAPAAPVDHSEHHH